MEYVKRMKANYELDVVELTENLWDKIYNNFLQSDKINGIELIAVHSHTEKDELNKAFIVPELNSHGYVSDFIVCLGDRLIICPKEQINNFVKLQ